MPVWSWYSVELIASPCPGVVGVVWSCGREETASGRSRSATFEVRNEVKVKVPEGAKQIRVWCLAPRGAAQQVSDIRVESPYPWRIGRDSEGNRVLYLESENPRRKSSRSRRASVVRCEVRTA